MGNTQIVAGQAGQAGLPRFARVLRVDELRDPCRGGPEVLLMAPRQLEIDVVVDFGLAQRGQQFDHPTHALVRPARHERLAGGILGERMSALQRLFLVLESNGSQGKFMPARRAAGHHVGHAFQSNDLSLDFLPNLAIGLGVYFGIERNVENRSDMPGAQVRARGPTRAAAAARAKPAHRSKAAHRSAGRESAATASHWRPEATAAHRPKAAHRPAAAARRGWAGAARTAAAAAHRSESAACRGWAGAAGTAAASTGGRRWA